MLFFKVLDNDELSVSMKIQKMLMIGSRKRTKVFKITPNIKFSSPFVTLQIFLHHYGSLISCEKLEKTNEWSQIYSKTDQKPRMIHVGCFLRTPQGKKQGPQLDSDVLTYKYVISFGPISKESVV